MKCDTGVRVKSFRPSPKSCQANVTGFCSIKLEACIRMWTDVLMVTNRLESTYS
jgi:hypothetical protein